MSRELSYDPAVGAVASGENRSSRARMIAAAVALLALGTCVLTVSATATKAAGPPGNRPGRYIVVLSNQNSGLTPGSAGQAAAAQSEQSPVVGQLQSVGATNIQATSIVNAVTATMTPSAANAVAGNSSVAEVVPDAVIQGPTPPAAGPSLPGHPGPNPSPPPCGTASSPELDPEGLANIHATPTELGSIDGAGVKVAFIADGINTSNPDFQRNAALASAGSPAGSPVITDYEDFSGDGTSAPTARRRGFPRRELDRRAGNEVYDLSQFVNPAHPLPAGCDIKIVGVAPGRERASRSRSFARTTTPRRPASSRRSTTPSPSGAKVINESFGSNNFPDTAARRDPRMADDAAVAAGVTVVVSSGDAGITSTIGSPATDPERDQRRRVDDVPRLRSRTTFGGINAPERRTAGASTTTSRRSRPAASPRTATPSTSSRLATSTGRCARRHRDVHRLHELTTAPARRSS